MHSFRYTPVVNIVQNVRNHSFWSCGTVTTTTIPVFSIVMVSRRSYELELGDNGTLTWDRGPSAAK